MTLLEVRDVTVRCRPPRRGLRVVYLAPGQDPLRRILAARTPGRPGGIAGRDYNLYEGTEVTGSPEIVLLRGSVLVDNGNFVAEPGVGQFVERAAFGRELLPAAAR